MQRHIDSEIRQYEAYFEKQIEDIGRVDSRLFRKILYSCVVDTLSKAAFGEQFKIHQKRVVSFIDACSGWKDKDEVSAIQLCLMLEQEQQTSSPLYNSLKERTKVWNRGVVRRPADDPVLSDVECIAGQGEKKCVRRARYVELLYTYRNHLVHEFREPGRGLETDVWPPDEPFYHSFIDEGPQLVFPVGFFEKLCKDCLSGLVELLTAQRRSPNDSYGFGSQWERERRKR